MRTLRRLGLEQGGVLIPGVAFGIGGGVLGKPGQALQDIGDLALVHQDAEVKAQETGFHAVIACQYLGPQRLGFGVADAQKTVTVGTGAGAAAAGLDAEMVGQHAGGELGVKVILPLPDADRKDRQAGGLGQAQNLNPRNGGQGGKALRGKGGVAGDLMVKADGILDDKGKTGADIAQDIGRSGLFPRLKPRQIVMRGGRDIADGAATGKDAARSRANAC